MTKSNTKAWFPGSLFLGGKDDTITSSGVHLQPYSWQANTDTTGFWKIWKSPPGPNGSPAMASPWVFVEVMHKAKNCLYFWIAWHASFCFILLHSASSSSLPWLRYASILGREAQISTWPGGLSTKSGEHPGLPFTYLSHGRVWHHRLVDPSLSRHVWNIWPRHTYPGCRKPRPSCGRPLHQRISKREMGWNGSSSNFRTQNASVLVLVLDGGVLSHQRIGILRMQMIWEQHLLSGQAGSVFSPRDSVSHNLPAKCFNMAWFNMV